MPKVFSYERTFDLSEQVPDATIVSSSLPQRLPNPFRIALVLFNAETFEDLAVPAEDVSVGIVDDRLDDRARPAEVQHRGEEAKREVGGGEGESMGAVRVATWTQRST